MSGLNRILKFSCRTSLFTLLVSAAACNSGGNSQTGDGSLPSEKTAHEPRAQFQDQKVAAVYEHYLHVKNALVQADSRDAQLGSSALEKALLHAGYREAAENAGKIAGMSDLKSQRAELNALTKSIEPVLKKMPLVGGKIYKQYCPMANEGDGGFWLSSESNIKNPYYGDEMLDCGEVKEVIE